MDELTPWSGARVFGRAQEISAVRALLDSDTRLITITGTGGIGKTRVALAAAPDDAFVVPLAAADGAGLLGAILRVVAPGAGNARDPMQAVASAAADRVVVLDTFEHLLGRSAVVAELMERAPRVQVIVTSRSRLRLDAEHVISIGPLDTAAAVEMFRDRMTAVGVSGGTDEEIAGLCDLLDRLPLALELGAARTTVFTPAQLLARLRAGEHGRVLGVLGRGPADVPERQRSIRATIEWSYVLLEEQVAALFRRLGVFPADFSLDAAEDICAGVPLSTDDVLDAIAALVDLHLVEPVASTSDVPRFRLLDALREYAIEQSEATGEDEPLLDRLVDWAVSFGVRAGVGLDSPLERDWLRAVDEETALLRIALNRLADQDDSRRGLALAGGIAMSWINLGPINEGRQWFDTFLALDSSAITDSERAIAIAWRSRLAVDLGDLSAIDELMLSRDAITDRPEWLRATENLAYSLTMRGDLDRVEELTAEALQVSETEPYWHSVFLLRQALTAQRQRQGELAVQCARKAAAAAAAVGYPRLVARAEQVIVNEKGVGAEAEAAAAAVLRAYEESGDRRGVVSALATFGAIAGRPTESIWWFRAALDEARRIGYRLGELLSIAGMAGEIGLAGRPRDAAELEGALRPYRPLILMNVPPRYFDMHAVVMDRIRAELGDKFDEIAGAAPEGWPWMRDRAHALADELAVEPTEAPAPARRRGRPAQSSLSDRELQVLAAVARGGTNQHISGELSISAKTVMHHTTSVYRKLGVRGRAEAIAYAYRTGLLAPASGGSGPTTAR